MSNELDKLVELCLGQVNRCRENGIDAREYWLRRSHPRTEVGVESGHAGVIASRRRKHIQVMAHSIVEPRERTIVNKRWLKPHVADWRGAAVVGVLGVASS